MIYLIAAYLIIGGTILGYVLNLWLRERNLLRQIDSLLQSHPDR